MPLERTQVYHDRQLKTVATRIGSYTFNFGFLTPVGESVSVTLGHRDITSSTTNLVLGANKPKPSKAYKEGISSYVASDSISFARLAGWTVRVNPLLNPPSTGIPHFGLATPRTMSVYVELGEIFYAWRMKRNYYEFFTTSQLQLLRIRRPMTHLDKAKMIFGARFPKPGRATKTVTSTSGVTQKVTTFYGDGANLTGFTNITLPYIESFI